jgi:MFS family permease
VIAIGSGCIADIADPEERGTFMGLFSAISMLGPAIGPVLGGILAQTVGWR